MVTSPDSPEVALLREHLGAGTETSDTALADYIDTAAELLGGYVADADPEIPARTLARAYRAVAAELFGQDQAPNGVLNQQFPSEDGVIAVPVRIGADPLRPAYALLGQWIDPVTFA